MYDDFQTSVMCLDNLQVTSKNKTYVYVLHATGVPIWFHSLILLY